MPCLGNYTQQTLPVHFIGFPLTPRENTAGAPVITTVTGEGKFISILKLSHFLDGGFPIDLVKRYENVEKVDFFSLNFVTFLLAVSVFCNEFVVIVSCFLLI